MPALLPKRSGKASSRAAPKPLGVNKVGENVIGDVGVVYDFRNHNGKGVTNGNFSKTVRGGLLSHFKVIAEGGSE